MMENFSTEPEIKRYVSGFGVVVLDRKMLIMDCYSVNEGILCVSGDVYQCGSRLNRYVLCYHISCP